MSKKNKANINTEENWFWRLLNALDLIDPDQEHYIPAKEEMRTSADECNGNGSFKSWLIVFCWYASPFIVILIVLGARALFLFLLGTF